MTHSSHHNTAHLGFSGEAYVTQFLIQQGFILLAQNYRQFFGEIDIIAQKNDLVIFVEVKTRSNQSSIAGELVGVGKQQKIALTAKYFLSEHVLYTKVTARFDVALVIKKKEEIFLEYIENAFQASE